jgi:hypothetical protein
MDTTPRASRLRVQEEVSYLAALNALIRSRDQEYARPAFPTKAHDRMYRGHLHAAERALENAITLLRETLTELRRAELDADLRLPDGAR